MKQDNMNTVESLQRRIRYLQRSIIQLASQPSIQRRNLYRTLYSNLRAARHQLRILQSGHGMTTDRSQGTMA